MRIAFTSDLHVEYHLEVVGLLADEVARRAPDALVLAGDVCADLARLERSLHLLARSLTCPVLFVPGNHELWCGGSAGSGPNSRERYERVVPALVRRAGALPLGLAPQRVAGVTFVGVTGWHDGSLAEPRGPQTERDPSASSRAPGALEEGGDDGPEPPVARAGPKRHRGTLVIMDQEQIHWPDETGAPLPAQALSAHMCTLLAAQLGALGEEAGRVVVVTHMLPHPGVLGELEGTEYAASTPYLGSSRLWSVIASHPRVALAVAGHLHLSRRVRLPGAEGTIWCEVSPVGYPREIPRDLPTQVSDRLRVVELH